MSICICINFDSIAIYSSFNAFLITCFVLLILVLVPSFHSLNQTIRWRVTFIDGTIDEINPTVKYIYKYVDGKPFSVYIEGIMKSITVGFKKGKSYMMWHFYWQSYWQISLVMPSVIFLWPCDRPSSPPSPFLLLPYVFFSATNNHPFPPNLNTIQPPTTNPATTTLSLLASVFWFKFYWGFSTLSKQIYLFFFIWTQF